jgi:hypothetical protein
MAGTGNLEVLRVCRFLRKRVGQQYGGTMYGAHMAHSMATGLLFLGGGKYVKFLMLFLCAWINKIDWDCVLA